MKKIIQNWKNIIYENRVFLGLVVITIFILILPILNGLSVIGDDYGFHLSRIQGIEQGLKAHQFPVKIFYGMANSYTYGAGLFYCNFFLYFPACLRLLHLPIMIIIKILVILTILAIIATTYIATKHITKNKTISMLVSILVPTSWYFRVNLYARFAMGEYIAMIFIPLIVAGMWDFVYNDFKKPTYLIVGFIGVIFSHIISVVLCVIFCIIFLLINIKKIFKHKMNLLKLIGSAILVALITMVYWLPMFEQLLAQTLRYQVNPLMHTYNRCVKVNNLFNTGNFSLGYMQSIIVLVAFLLLIKNWKKTKIEVKQFYIIGTVLLILIPFRKFWRCVLVLDIIQFPWRLLGIANILISISFSILILEEFKQDTKIVQMIIFLTLFMCLIEPRDYTLYADLPEDLYQIPVSLGGGGEYLPANSLMEEGEEIDYTKLDFPQEAINEKNEKLEGTKKYLTFEFENKIEDEMYLVPFFYYKGYQAKHMDDLNHETKLDVTLGDKGLVKVENVKSPGKIIVWYEETGLQKISYITSLVSIIVTFVLFIRYRMIRKQGE